MNKSELIKEVSKIMLDPKDAELAVCKTFETMSKALAAGEKVVISNFGAFRISHRKARQGRNPKTGDPVAVPPGKTVRFKASPGMLT